MEPKQICTPHRPPLTPGTFILSCRAVCVNRTEKTSTWVQEHRFEFDEAPSVEAVAAQLSRLALKFNGYDKDGRAGSGREDEGGGGGLAMSRPVGVALLMAGIDHGNRPVLYHLGPSGELRRAYSRRA